MILERFLLLSALLRGAVAAIPSQAQKNSDTASSPQGPDITWAGGITWTGHIEEGGDVMTFTGSVRFLVPPRDNRKNAINLASVDC